MDIQKELDLPFPLRPYQEEGVGFLESNDRALLGDDMGLGKTVQTIVALKKLYKKVGVFRCLLVVPSSLITNWVNEFKIWFPKVKITVVKGDKKNRDSQFMHTDGFIICSYEQMRNSYDFTHSFRDYEVVIYDEAQRLKNKESKSHIAAKYISSEKLWMLTGTPLENSEEDLKNISSFIDSKLITGFDTPSDMKIKIKSFMLRRLKTEVLTELPELIEENKYIDMTFNQKKEYNSLYSSRKGLNRKDSGSLLGLITELKKACNFAPESRESAKMDYLNEILDEVSRKGEKVIIFSQYVKTLEEINKSLKIKSHLYHGKMKAEDKDKTLNEYKNEKGFSLLLMSLKAGGVGLNLQEASTIILFDRWWNPATESQAIARAHRMGNKSSVHAIKFVTSGTIEERILDLLHEKKELFEFVIDEDIKKGSNDKLLEILELKE
tara:strand:- start:420 stop:1730 length:1311 start_codon:yes stop_codon:yes gene_type:complete